MHWLAGLFTLMVIHALGLISPGPDFAVVLKNSLSGNRRGGVMTAFGIASSLCLHLTYCIAGLAVIIVHSIWIYHAFKYLGGAYLVYIGVKAFLSKGDSAQLTETNQGNQQAHHFREGFLTNLLNPKCALYVLGIFTLLISPSTPIWVQLIYGGWMVISTFFWFSLVALMINHRQVKTRLLALQHWTPKLMGLVLIGFGVVLALWH